MYVVLVQVNTTDAYHCLRELYHSASLAAYDCTNKLRCCICDYVYNTVYYIPQLTINCLKPDILTGLDLKQSF